MGGSDLRIAKRRLGLTPGQRLCLVRGAELSCAKSFSYAHCHLAGAGWASCGVGNVLSLRSHRVPIRFHGEIFIGVAFDFRNAVYPGEGCISCTPIRVRTATTRILVISHSPSSF